MDWWMQEMENFTRLLLGLPPLPEPAFIIQVELKSTIAPPYKKREEQKKKEDTEE